MIGVLNTEYPAEMDEMFDDISEGDICTGYGLSSCGHLTNPEWPSSWGKHFKQYNTGDIIEMIIDFNQLTIDFIINDKSRIEGNKAFDIKQSEYRAAVKMRYNGHSIELVSYRQIE